MPSLDHPALQLHQFALEAEQFAEIQSAAFLFAALRGVFIEQGVQVMPVFGQFQLQFFVTVIEQLAVDALYQGVLG